MLIALAYLLLQAAALGAMVGSVWSLALDRPWSATAGVGALIGLLAGVLAAGAAMSRAGRSLGVFASSWILVGIATLTIAIGLGVWLFRVVFG